MAGDGAGASDEPLFCGVDVGASSTKLVLLDDGAEVRARTIRKSGVDYTATARACLETAAAEVAAAFAGATSAGAEAAAGATASAGVDAWLNNVVRTVSTGYGRRNVDYADDARTELQCHGVGCYHHYPEAITIIDIGCQDNKIIRLDEGGRRVDFKMNRKCAAGTGAFLEEIALRLDIKPDELEALASSTEDAIPLNSFCTVFASTEILAHLRRGEPLAGLVRGAFASVINRVAEMDRLQGGVILTGGVVAHNPTIAEILAEKLGGRVHVPPDPQFTGALGAALIARSQFNQSQEENNA